MNILFVMKNSYKKNLEIATDITLCLVKSNSSLCLKISKSMRN